MKCNNTGRKFITDYIHTSSEPGAVVKWPTCTSDRKVSSGPAHSAIHRRAKGVSLISDPPNLTTSNALSSLRLISPSVEKNESGG